MNKSSSIYSFTALMKERSLGLLYGKHPHAVLYVCLVYVHEMLLKLSNVGAFCISLMDYSFFHHMKTNKSAPTLSPVLIFRNSAISTFETDDQIKDKGKLHPMMLLALNLW